MLPQREKAARILAKASKIPAEKLDLVTEAGTDLDVAAPWAAPEEAVPRDAVSGAVAMVETSVPGDDGSAGAAMREKPALHYETVRPILALLGEPDALGTAPAGRCVLGAVRRLPGFSRAGSRTGRCCRARSTPHRCPRCGDARCSRAPSCRRARSAATRTRCACWSSRTARAGRAAGPTELRHRPDLSHRSGEQGADPLASPEKSDGGVENLCPAPSPG
ncbi:hypothetical protein GCM10010398_62300 [Streptomyces fimbriatus]